MPTTSSTTTDTAVMVNVAAMSFQKIDDDRIFP